MGLFSRNKKEAPQSAETTPAFEPLDGPYAEICCAVSVSLDGKTHNIESDGSIRFYDGVVSVYAISARNQAKNLLRPVIVPNIAPVETLRYPYSEISRVFFARKITAKVEFSDGKYAFFVIMNGGDRDRFTALFTGHGVAVEPFKK